MRVQRSGVAAAVTTGGGRWRVDRLNHLAASIVILLAIPAISDMRAPSSPPRCSVRQSLHLSIPSRLLFIHLRLAEIFGCTSLMPVVSIGKARTTLSSLIPYFLFHLRLMKLSSFKKILLIIYSPTYLSLSIHPLYIHPSIHS